MLPFAQQLYAFGMTVVAGIAAGLVFDLYRLVRRHLRPNPAVSWLMDLLFWLVLTPVVFALLLVGNWGELRFYVFLGLASGLVLYFGLFSQPVRGIMAGLCRCLGQSLLFACRLLVGLLSWPLRLARGWSGAGRWGRPGWGRPWRLRIPRWWRPISWTPLLFSARGRRI